MTWATAAWWGSGAMVAAGLVLLLLALFRDRSRGRRRCPRCWYDMACITGMTCPECGRTQHHERSFGRTRRRWRRATLAVLIMFVGASSALAPAAVTGEWAKHTPTPLLRLAMSFFEETAEEYFQRNFLLGAGRPPTSAYERLLLAQYWRKQIRGYVDEPESMLRFSLGSPAFAPWGALTWGDEVKVAVPEMVAAFRSDHPLVRQMGHDALDRLGKRAALCAREMREILADAQESRSQRLAALRVLVRIPMTDARTVRLLRRLSEQDSSGIVRSEAAAGLIVLDPASPRTFGAVTRVSVESDPVLRGVAARWLGWYAHSREASFVPPVAIGGASAELRHQPGTAFPVASPRAEAVDRLAAMLDDPEPHVRSTVADVLSGVAERVSPVADRVRRRFEQEPDAGVRRRLIRAYVEAPAARVDDLLPELQAALFAEDISVANWAVVVVRECGARAASLAPELERRCAGAGANERDRLCSILAGLGPEGHEALERMMYQEPGDRTAAWWLGVACGRGGGAEARLLGAIGSSDERLRAAAARGLGAFDGGREIFAVLARLCRDDPSASVRVDALMSAARCIEHQAELRELLDRGAADPDERVRNTAAFLRRKM